MHTSRTHFTKYAEKTALRLVQFDLEWLWKKFENTSSVIYDDTFPLRGRLGIGNLRLEILHFVQNDKTSEYFVKFFHHFYEVKTSLTQ